MNSDLNEEAEITVLVMGQEKLTVPSALKTFVFYNVAASVLLLLEVNEPFPWCCCYSTDLQEQFAALKVLIYP